MQLELRLWLVCMMISITAAFSVRAQPATLPHWTIMIFMNGDNNLEPDALMNFRQMAAVGGNKEVNVVIQFDRIGKYAHTQPDWTQTLRFAVTKGMHPLPAEATQDIGEADMGDPKVLSDFVKWARANYPAQHYMLVIWDHGEGWRLFLTTLLNKQRAAVHSRTLLLADSARAQIAAAATLRHGYGIAGRNGISAPLTAAPSDGFRSASNDETDNDVLYDREIEDGLKDALHGAKLDVLAFDACLMSMVETGYAMRDSANVLLASEELVPGPGWPYDDILAAVEAQNPTNGVALAKIVVSAYKSHYQAIASDTTFAAIDLSKISSIAEKVSGLADALTPELSANLQGIVSARDATSTYAPGYQFYHVDIREFMEQMKSRTASASVLNAISVAESEIDSAVISNYAGADRQGPYGSFGLAIYFPATSANHVSDPYAEGGYEKDNTYYPVEFVQKFHWADFLHAYWNLVP